MLRVGVTGGIGSGKSYVCKIFEYLGIKVFYADIETKKLYNSNQALKQELIKNFGNQVYLPNGDFNRVKFSEILFSDSTQLNKANSIIHPYTFQHYENWCMENASETYTLKEAAIMFESGSHKYVDKVICVSAPLELRIARTMERDSVSRETVVQKMNRQWPQEKILALSDYTILNDEKNSVIEQVLAIHSQLIGE